MSNPKDIPANHIIVPVDYALIQLDMLRASNEKLIEFYMDELRFSIHLLNHVSVQPEEQDE